LHFAFCTHPTLTAETVHIFGYTKQFTFSINNSQQHLRFREHPFGEQHIKIPFQSSNKKIRKWGFIWGKTSQKYGFHLGKNITKIGVCNRIVKHTKVPFDLQKKNTKIRASNCPHEAMAAIHLCYSFPTEHYLFFLNRRILAFSLNRKVQFSFSYFSSLACVSQPQHSLHLLSRVTALLSFKIIKIMNAA